MNKNQGLAENIREYLLSWNAVTKLFAVYPVPLEWKQLWDDPKCRKILSLFYSSTDIETSAAFLFMIAYMDSEDFFITSGPPGEK